MMYIGKKIILVLLYNTLWLYRGFELANVFHKVLSPLLQNISKWIEFTFKVSLSKERLLILEYTER